jgi:hypothetical protein
MLLMKVAIDPLAEYSPKKMEMGREKRIEMIRAKKEVASVPTIKGNPPNSFLTGSHVELKRNRIPKFRIAGKEAMNSEKKMASRISRTKAPATESIFRKQDSDNTGLCQRQRIVSVSTPNTRTSALL